MFHLPHLTSFLLPIASVGTLHECVSGCPNPEGILPSSPRLRRRSYLGCNGKIGATPNGVVANSRATRINPIRTVHPIPSRVCGGTPAIRLEIQSFDDARAGKGCIASPERGSTDSQKNPHIRFANGNHDNPHLVTSANHLKHVSILSPTRPGLWFVQSPQANARGPRRLRPKSSGSRVAWKPPPNRHARNRVLRGSAIMDGGLSWRR